MMDRYGISFATALNLKGEPVGYHGVFCLPGDTYWRRVPWIDGDAVFATSEIAERHAGYALVNALNADLRS